MANMEPEPERVRLAGDYPRWGIFRRGSVVVAWLPPLLPLLVFRDATAAGLRQRIETFEDVLHDTGSLNEAEAAAIELET